MYKSFECNFNSQFDFLLPSSVAISHYFQVFCHSGWYSSFTSLQIALHLIRNIKIDAVEVYDDHAEKCVLESCVPIA